MLSPFVMIVRMGPDGAPPRRDRDPNALLGTLAGSERAALPVRWLSRGAQLRLLRICVAAQLPTHTLEVHLQVSPLLAEAIESRQLLLLLQGIVREASLSVGHQRLLLPTRVIGACMAVRTARCRAGVGHAYERSSRFSSTS